MKMSNFDRNYSPGNRHMICIGKTKTTSEEGLFNDCVNTMAFVSFIFFPHKNSFSTGFSRSTYAVPLSPHLLRTSNLNLVFQNQNKANP